MKYAILAVIFFSTSCMQIRCMMDQDDRKMLLNPNALLNTSYRTSPSINQTPSAPPDHSNPPPYSALPPYNPYTNVDIEAAGSSNRQSQPTRTPGAPLPSDIFDRETGETFAQWWLKHRVPWSIQQAMVSEQKQWLEEHPYFCEKCGVVCHYNDDDCKCCVRACECLGGAACAAGVITITGLVYCCILNSLSDWPSYYDYGLDPDLPPNVTRLPESFTQTLSQSITRYMSNGNHTD